MDQSGGIKTRISKERLAGILLFVLVGYAAVSIVWGTVLWDIEKDDYFIPPPLSAGTQAPAFELTSLTGETLSLSQFSNRPLVIMFWGSS